MLQHESLLSKAHCHEQAALGLKPAQEFDLTIEFVPSMLRQIAAAVAGQPNAHSHPLFSFPVPTSGWQNKTFVSQNPL